ncbi:hypothetical protein ACVWWJ_002674 [Luteibacter sp. HA06]
MPPSRASEPPSLAALSLALIAWLSKAWAPLAAASLSIAALYWVEFIRYFAIPVNFGASAGLTALPALAATMFAVIAIIAVFCLIPSLALWVPLGKERRRLLDGHRARNSALKGPRDPFRSGDLERGWVAVNCFLGALWAGVIAISVMDEANVSLQWLGSGVLVASTAVSWLAFGPVRRRARIEGDAAWILFFLQFVSGLVQGLVQFGVLQAGLTATGSLNFVGWMQLIAFGSGGIVMVSIAQYAMALAIAKGPVRNTPRTFVLLMLGLVAVPLLVPPLGASVASVPFRLRGPDGRSCVTLTPTSGAKRDDWSGILESGASTTVPLWATRLDDTYYVKRDTRSTTIVIPAVQVQGVSSCPPSGAAVKVDASAVPVATAVASGASMHVEPSIWVAIGALCVSVMSLMATLALHRRAHRPLVSVRITAHDGGNLGISLDIVVENTGTRPALNVVLEAGIEDVRQVMLDESENALVPKDAGRVFFSDIRIPVLANGRMVTNAFGQLGTQGCWKPGAVLPITVSYSAMDGQHFSESFGLLLADDIGFAQTSWGPPVNG